MTTIQQQARLDELKERLLSIFDELDSMMDQHNYELKKFSAGVKLQAELTPAILSGAGECEMF